jgi:hypothetical protein
MRWFLPSFNGDVRFEEHPDDAKSTLMIVHNPTDAEVAALDKLSATFKKRGWIEDRFEIDSLRKAKASRTIHAVLSDVAPVAISILKAGEQTLSAVVLKDGKVETVEGTDMKGLEAIAKADAEAGAAVKRPTPCCPACHEGAVGPATEALLAFMTEEQHAQWAEHRYLVAVGQLSGHRYMLAHRHSERAHYIGRVCYDLDSAEVVHFHDMTVPPEEEVLAAKLILENAEPWLRNEATLFGTDDRYKNPFGDGGDGVEDSVWTADIGKIFRSLVL